MHDLKLQLGLDGDHNWPRVDLIRVDGSKFARRILPGDDVEAVIRSWTGIAVLRLEPPLQQVKLGNLSFEGAPWSFRLGFMATASNGAPFMQYLRKPVKSKYLVQGMIGVRIGPTPVTFIVMDAKMRYQIGCQLHTVTTLDDPIYSRLQII